MSEKEPAKPNAIKAGLDKVLDVIAPTEALQSVKLPEPIQRSDQPKPKIEEKHATIVSRATATATIEPATPAHVEVERPITPGWNVLPAEHLPKPTYWPVVMGLGITFVAFGVVTTFIISAVGLLLFIVSLIGWIGDVRDEQQEH